MIKVLMVCLGNICRSPLAQGIFEKKLKEKGIDHVEVDSAGTSDYHIGEAPDIRTIENAEAHGLDVRDLRGRQFQQEDYDEFDHIFVMDQSNYADVLALARNEEDKEKVDLLLHATHPGTFKSVPDPYFGGAEGFENVYQLIENACDKIAEDIGIETK